MSSEIHSQEKSIRRPVHKGPFIKECPCTPGAVSCGYFNANLQTGCRFRCTYCILQEYLETLEPVFFRNWRDIARELEKIGDASPFLRLGTGELSDSLVFEDLTAFSRRIIKMIEPFPRVIFEFKTKSDKVNHLLKIKKVPKNIIVSWSLNPDPIILREEKGTPSLKRRLEAMAAVQAKGYKVGIHFDPLILFPGWEEQYLDLIRLISGVLHPGSIAWWSMGALRFSPAMRPHILKHKQTILFWGELVPGFDGKYRYFKPLRIDLFRKVMGVIQKEISAEIPLYLCMEDVETWREVFPRYISDPAEINRRLFDSVFR